MGYKRRIAARLAGGALKTTWRMLKMLKMINNNNEQLLIVLDPNQGFPVLLRDCSDS